MIKDYIYQIFNNLTIIAIDRERMKKEQNKNGKSNSYVMAKCSCNGNIKSYNLNKIKRGETNSCGCYKIKRIKETKKKYNNFDIVTKEYGILYIEDCQYLFDKEDYEKIKDMWWYADSNGYATHMKTASGKSLSMRLHRFILNPKENEYIDHINRNVKDNRKNNLRICSH